MGIIEFIGAVAISSVLWTAVVKTGSYALSKTEWFKRRMEKKYGSRSIE